MQKIMWLAGLAVLAACGVPPEEDAAAKSDYEPLAKALFMPVDAADLAQSQAWADTLKRYK